MTLELLNKIYEENDIPKDALLMSDSGWECYATDMDGVFYSKERNTVFITQGDWSDIAYGYDFDDCVLIYVTDEDLNRFVDMYNSDILNYRFELDKPVIEELKISPALRRKIIEKLQKKEG